jgi:hypothetical protein
MATGDWVCYGGVRWDVWHSPGSVAFAGKCGIRREVRRKA